MAGEMAIDLSSNCIIFMTDESQGICTKYRIDLYSSVDK